MVESMEIHHDLQWMAHTPLFTFWKKKYTISFKELIVMTWETHVNISLKTYMPRGYQENSAHHGAQFGLKHR